MFLHKISKEYQDKVGKFLSYSRDHEWYIFLNILLKLDKLQSYGQSFQTICCIYPNNTFRNDNSNDYDVILDISIYDHIQYYVIVVRAIISKCIIRVWKVGYILHIGWNDLDITLKFVEF